MATQIARQPSSFELELSAYEPQFRAALPSHITPEKFRRTIVTAVNREPKLVKADRRSLFISCVQCAQDGLLPDGRQAALVIFGEAVQYMPMYQGILHRMRNTGDVANASAHVVYELDKFRYVLGDDARIEHEPAIGDRGSPIGAYAIITLTDGEKIRDWMTTAEIEKVRAVSRMKNGAPWTQWWDQMARKTVLRRAAKWAPVSSEVHDLLDRENTYEPIAEPQPAGQQRISKLDRFEDTRADGTGDGGNPPQQQGGSVAKNGAPDAGDEPQPVLVLDVPADDAHVRFWQEYRKQLVAAIKNAPSRTWLAAFEEQNHDGMAKLAEDYPQNREVSDALAGRSAELGA